MKRKYIKPVSSLLVVELHSNLTDWSQTEYADSKGNEWEPDESMHFEEESNIGYGFYDANEQNKKHPIKDVWEDWDEIGK